MADDTICTGCGRPKSEGACPDCGPLRIDEGTERALAAELELDKNPRLYSYRLVQDDSTKWEEVIRITDPNGAVIEDMPIWDAPAEMVAMLRQHESTVNSIENTLAAAQLMLGASLYNLAQHVWAQRGKES